MSVLRINLLSSYGPTCLTAYGHDHRMPSLYLLGALSSVRVYTPYKFSILGPSVTPLPLPTQRSTLRRPALTFSGLDLIGLPYCVSPYIYFFLNSSLPQSYIGCPITNCQERYLSAANLLYTVSTVIIKYQN